MYIIKKEYGLFGINSGEPWYLGWQEPAWDEDGYFWTKKNAIKEILQMGNNTKEHPFLFNTQEQAKKFAKKLKITDYDIEEWS